MSSDRTGTLALDRETSSCMRAPRLRRFVPAAGPTPSPGSLEHLHHTIRGPGAVLDFMQRAASRVWVYKKRHASHAPRLARLPPGTRPVGC